MTHTHHLYLLLWQVHGHWKTYLISRSIQPDNGIVKSAISEIYKILEQMEKGEFLAACYGTSRENGLWTWGKRSVKQLRL